MGLDGRSDAHFIISEVKGAFVMMLWIFFSIGILYITSTVLFFNMTENAIVLSTTVT